MLTLEEEISNKRNTLKTDRLDMSFGELMNIYNDDELFIVIFIKNSLYNLPWKMSSKTLKKEYIRYLTCIYPFEVF